MQLVTVTIMLCALGVAAGKKIPINGKNSNPHHSTKKQLKPSSMSDPLRLPRKIEMADGSDYNPAVAYALPPSAHLGLLHQGQGFSYGLGQGQEAAALAALVSAGLQVEAPKRERALFHYPGPLLQAHVPAAPIQVEEPRQEVEPLMQTAHAVQAEAHSFIDTPHLYKQNQHEDEYKDYAAKYQFGYRVRDLHTGNDFGQTESRDGHVTHGHYHVLLPDGRLQNVQYWSDDSGFHAKVSYDGHSHHGH